MTVPNRRPVPFVKTRPIGRRLSSLILPALCGAIVAIWWRNRDILRDLFDYSMVIGAAGKSEAGLKPYTDIRSPMQSAMYLLNHAAEVIFGRSYLGLTWGGLVQALGGTLVLRAVALRPLGAVMGTLLAAAVAMAGLVQHVVFFYNPIGILCLAIVLIGLADQPSLWPPRSWRSAVVLLALFLSGINKVNFHAVTVGIGALLLVSGWLNGRAAGRSSFGTALLLVLFGGALPLGFELAWTGAGFSEWFHNVVALPAERRGLLYAIIGWRMYLRPIHDFHHHLLIRSIGGIGLLLLLATGAWLLRDALERGRPRSDLLVRSALVLSGVVGGALLMVTNMESAMLTSLLYPVLSAALFASYRESVGPAWRGWGAAIVSALVVWSLAGGYAAWHGSRVLYGLNPPERWEYIRLNTAGPALHYFEGVRLLPAQIEANQRLAARMRELEHRPGHLSGVLFGPGLEWMERVYPDCITRHEPVWYHAGTTLRESDAAYFSQLLGADRRLAAQRAWEIWPASIRAMLERDFEMETVSARDVLYLPRGIDSRAPGRAAP
jgi:hypothetical protein